MDKNIWICPLDDVEVPDGKECPECGLNEEDAEEAKEEREEFEEEMMKATVYGNYHNWPF